MTSAIDSPWLVCQDLAKNYGGVTALDGVDLALRAGTVLGLIGPNGAGKSTLSQIIGGSVAPDRGVIQLDGREVKFGSPAEAQDRGLVLMPQEIAILPTATVIDNVTLGREPTRGPFRSGANSLKATEIALEAVGLDVDPRALASSLAPPHQRMLMMARAVNRDARLLILDEPTAGLAENEASLVVDSVRRLMDRHLTVIYVSHHLSEVATLCDEVVCIRASRVAARLTGASITKAALVDLVLDVDAESGQRIAASKTLTAVQGPPSVQLIHANGERLRDVSFHASVGEVVGVTGLLGAGVSELVSFLVGASKPQSGSLELNGSPVDLGSPAEASRHGVGYLPGDRGRAAFGRMPIRENVSLPALTRWFGKFGLVSRKSERRQVGDCLAALSVNANQENPISSLSGGNQQRALVARLIAADSKILILDEPTVGVDIRARAELWAEVRRLAETRTVIVASSEPEELAGLADRVVCIRHGSVAKVLEGTDITDVLITEAIA